MTFSYKTTETTDALSQEGLRGWGAAFTLFCVRSQEDGLRYGYEENNPEHKLLLMGGSESPALCCRFLHYFEATDGFSAADLEASAREREALEGLDGLPGTALELGAAGVGIPPIEWLE